MLLSVAGGKLGISVKLDHLSITVIPNRLDKKGLNFAVQLDFEATKMSLLKQIFEIQIKIVFKFGNGLAP